MSSLTETAAGLGANSVVLLLLLLVLLCYHTGAAHRSEGVCAAGFARAPTCQSPGTAAKPWAL
jgi:hypothetical protein